MIKPLGKRQITLPDKLDRAWFVVVLLAGLASVLAAQQQPGPPVAGNLPTQPVGASDLLLVTIYNQPQLSRTIRVSPDGFIRLPILRQRLPVVGMLPTELEETIAAAYQSEGILVEPQVTVNIAEYHSRPIQVGGSVKRPLTFQAEGPITLLAAINRAEGLTDIAGPEILVTKAEVDPDGNKLAGMTRRIAVKALFESGEESANIVLTGGEEVRVPEAGRIFVVGNVKKPGQFPLKQAAEVTVLQALALSEGLLQYSTNQAYIYRREGNGQKNEIPIELEKIMARKSPDVALLPDDILYVPENSGKKRRMNALDRAVMLGGGAAAAALVYTTAR